LINFYIIVALAFSLKEDNFIIINCTLKSFLIIDGQNYTLPRYTRGDYK